MNESNNIIQKSTVIIDEFVDQTTIPNRDLQVTLSNGNTLSFTAESRLYTPRRIQTNAPEILNLPEDYVVSRTPNNVPVVKLPIGAKDITTPQYYANSIVKDVYQIADINNFFTELTDDLTLPAEPKVLQSLRDQRDASLLAASALEDLINGVQAGDPDVVLQANDDLEDGLETAATFEPNIDELLTPEEEQEIAALDMVDLLNSDVEASIAEDIIDPLPEVGPENVATALPYLQSKLDGIETINKGIEYLNAGLGVVENSVQDTDRGKGQCEQIPIAKGKRKYGIGKRKSITVNRNKLVERRNFARSELRKQRETDTPIPDYYKAPQYLLKSRNDRLVAGFQTLQSRDDATGTTLKLSAELSKATRFVALIAFKKKFNPNRKYNVSKKFVPMTRDQIIEILEVIENELQKILDRPC